MAGVLFEDIFNVKDIDPEGKKFDRGKLIIVMIYYNKMFACLVSEKIFW